MSARKLGNRAIGVVLLATTTAVSCMGARPTPGGGAPAGGGNRSPLVTSMKKIARVLGIVEDVTPKPPPEAPELYKRALAFLEAQKFADALALLDEFQRQEPTSHYAQVANWNSGRALEGLGRWTEAAERYRAVALNCEGIAPRLQSLALYRLSFTSEALGDDAAEVAVLHDLLGRAGNLPAEVAGAELPARLASAYARIGNFDEALSFYKKAEVGIRTLRRTTGTGALPDWLPRTLYFMGSMSLRRVSWDDFEAALRPVSRGQTYLLQAAELGAVPWSERAAQDLMTTYRELWNAVSSAPRVDASDALVSERKIQRLQWDRAGLLLDDLLELRARFLPRSSATSTSARDLEAFTRGLGKQIEKLLAQRPAGEGPTPESAARKAALRGSVVSPDATLERQYKKGARATLPATHVPDQTASQSSDDAGLAAVIVTLPEYLPSRTATPLSRPAATPGALSVPDAAPIQAVPAAIPKEDPNL